MSGHTITPGADNKHRTCYELLRFNSNLSPSLSQLLMCYPAIVTDLDSQGRMDPRCTWGSRWPDRRGLSSPRRRPHNTDWCTLWRRGTGFYWYTQTKVWCLWQHHLSVSHLMLYKTVSDRFQWYRGEFGECASTLAEVKVSSVDMSLIWL